MIRTVETAGGLRLLGLIGNSFSWEAHFIALASLVLLNFKWQDLCQEVQLLSRSEAVTSLSTIDRHAASSCYLQFCIHAVLASFFFLQTKHQNSLILTRLCWLKYHETAEQLPKMTSKHICRQLLLSKHFSGWKVSFWQIYLCQMHSLHFSSILVLKNKELTSWSNRWVDGCNQPPDQRPLTSRCYVIAMFCLKCNCTAKLCFVSFQGVTIFAQTMLISALIYNF